MVKSRRYKARLLAGVITAAGAGLLAGLAGSGPASASASGSASGSASASGGTVPGFTPGQARYDTGLSRSAAPAAATAAATASSIPHFTATATVGSSQFTYSMVGKNPAKPVTNAATTVHTYLVPLVIKFADGRVWDPTKVDSCDSGASPLARTQQSPLFASQSWTWGGTQVGTGQVTDAFERASFWQYAQPGGANPTYGVNLGLTTLPKVTVAVPSADSAEYSIKCGNKVLGAVEINWLDSYLQSTVIPSLAGSGVTPTTFPVFLVHNVVSYQATTTNCCVLGYHNAFQATATSGVQTYAESMYDNSRVFTGSSNITALSHEIGEWMDDPFTNNPTPAWGHTGQVTGCQSTLEVGDPLTGVNFTDPVGGFTYDVQELAFGSWFYRQQPGTGINGWYSDQGTFTAPAAACP